MDFSKAFRDAASIFFAINLFSLVGHLIEKHDKGEFDYKDFTKFSFFAFVVSGLSFFISLIGGLIKK